MAALESIPVLAAWMAISSRTESICRPTNSGGRSWTPWTPTVFWAVTDVIADAPKTPGAAKVFRSARIPAPPPESEPAMVNARRIASADPAHRSLSVPVSSSSPLAQSSHEATEASHLARRPAYFPPYMWVSILLADIRVNEGAIGQKKRYGVPYLFFAQEPFNLSWTRSVPVQKS